MMMRRQPELPSQVIRATKYGNAESKAAKEFIKNARGSRSGDHVNYKAAVRKYISDNQSNASLITDQFAKKTFNALYSAISWYGDVEMVSILLDAGFKVNTACHMRRNDTALMIAAHKGKLEIVKLLLERGADLFLVNTEGKTAEEQATDNKQYVVASYLKQKREDLAQVKRPPTRADDLAQIGMGEGTVDPLFCCPITHKVMQEPITVSTGATYDRKSLADAFVSAGNPESIVCVVTSGTIKQKELNNLSYG